MPEAVRVRCAAGSSGRVGGWRFGSGRQSRYLRVLQITLVWFSTSPSLLVASCCSGSSTWFALHEGGPGSSTPFVVCNSTAYPIRYSSNGQCFHGVATKGPTQSPGFYSQDSGFDMSGASSLDSELPVVVTVLYPSVKTAIAFSSGYMPTAHEGSCTCFIYGYFLTLRACRCCRQSYGFHEKSDHKHRW